MVSRIWGLGAFSLICVLAIGCGSGGPTLGTVTGQVTLDGKPLPNALVTFMPEGEGGAATGARQALLAVGVEGAIEVAGFTVHVDVERIEGCSALTERVAHDRPRVAEEFGITGPVSFCPGRSPWSLDRHRASSA